MTTNLLWSNLESTLDNIINQFEGVAGLSIRCLNNNKTISINGDDIFPTASSIKIHILTQLFTLEDKGTIDLAKRVRFTQDMYGAGSGVIHFLENEPEFTILDIAILMMLVSDNTATNMCIDLAGMQETNNLIKDLGLSKTKLGRKMMDPDAINRGEENISTPNELTKMMELLYQKKPSPKVANNVLNIMSKPKSAYLNKAIGPNTKIANKPGGMDKVRCDVGIVYLPNNPYAISIMSNYGITDSLSQESFVIELAKTAHKFMLTLDQTNEFGLGLPTTIPL
ncbi:MAG: class A beta-lactamase-related serine hydrolase [Dehalococcoidia bacterium]|jgi:beta-lactamase class A|nr:class A beta-lactamase-related serine hydrolase [Dehalococcoidia bacterium]|tara:strand:- start:3956 stop:4801 length:846 start_codon:yes stop_codon:yes gene_type:complete